jgi:hypothetical protein
MGGCLSQEDSSYFLSEYFLKIKIDNKQKCKLCMKYVKYNTIKCFKCNNNIGHPYCLKLWYSINSNCPVCN